MKTILKNQSIPVSLGFEKKGLLTINVLCILYGIFKDTTELQCFKTIQILVHCTNSNVLK